MTAIASIGITRAAGAGLAVAFAALIGVALGRRSVRARTADTSEVATDEHTRGAPAAAAPAAAESEVAPEVLVTGSPNT